MNEENNFNSIDQEEILEFLATHKTVWVQITKELAQQRATTIESDVINEIGTDAEIDPMEQCILSSCAEIRSAIVQGGGTVGETPRNFVPPSLINCALSITIYHWASRGLSDTIVVQSSRYQEYQRALKTLDDVRSGKIKVENPDGDLSSNSSVKIVESKPRKRFFGINML